MSFAKQGDCAYEPAAPVNTGILADEMVAPATHMRMVRRISFINPNNGESWQVLTNELTLPPGLVGKLHLMRWDIEKMFDEFKNKIMERKSWASSVTAKYMQAVFLCLTHNLMILQEEILHRSVKFIRWLRSYLFGDASWDRMLAALRKVYQAP